MTYTIVARDASTGQLGVACQSHFFGVGAVVARAEAGVGVVASQAFANADLPHVGLDALRGGYAAPEVLASLVDGDALPAFRQIAVLDAGGAVAHHTGDRCAPHTGSAAADGVVALGNMLGSDRVWTEMLDAYTGTYGTLVERLYAALAAGEEAGGDARGSESAMLYVVSGERSDTPWRQVLCDIRVDDHAEPVAELGRLLPHHRAFGEIGRVLFGPPLVIGYETPTPEQAEAAMPGLAEAAALLGPNREADLWRGVILARAGRRAEAATVLAEVCAVRPTLRGFLLGLGSVGFLADAHDLVG